MRILAIIPARFKSSRFPGKALVDVNGKTMVQRVYEQACKAQGLTKVVVATDDQRIYSHLESIGGNVHMTRSDHPSGTDRCREALELEAEDFDFVLNIQGDEPFIDPNQIDELTGSLDAHVQIATQARVIKSQEKLKDINCVKVMINGLGNAIYFSRSPVPFQRSIPEDQWVDTFNYYQHIGIYAYRPDVLKEITQIPPSSLEKAEALEQLRWLEHGYKIRVQTTEHQAYGIDTREDLEQILSSGIF